MIVLQKHCKKHSRPVGEADFDMIKEAAEDMIELCRAPLGQYPFAFALAHCQVNHKDPMAFFVTHDGRVIINPKIVGYSIECVKEKEGCYSYAFRAPKIMRRRAVVYVDYQFMGADGSVNQARARRFSGDWARVFQHELDHFQGCAIFS